MFFQLHFNSGLPVYLQLVDQVKAAAASGTLRSGEPLPAIRSLAEQLRINRNTVAKAYAELESQGIIQNLPGVGCFLTDGPSPYRKEVRLKMLRDGVDELVVKVHHLQIGREEFLNLVNERLNALEEKTNASDKK